MSIIISILIFISRIYIFKSLYYLLYIYIIHLLYIYYTYIIHILYIYYTYIIHILYYTYIIHISYSICITDLVGGLNPSEKYYSMGGIIPYIMENKKCSKPLNLRQCSSPAEPGRSHPTPTRGQIAKEGGSEPPEICAVLNIGKKKTQWLISRWM